MIHGAGGLLLNQVAGGCKALFIFKYFSGNFSYHKVKGSRASSNAFRIGHVLRRSPNAFLMGGFFSFNNAYFVLTLLAN